MSVNKILHSWVFWAGTGLIVFAYFTAKGSAQQTGEGLDNGLTLVGVGAGVALVIYAINSAPTPA
jgi:hypothetical protein